MHGAQVLGLPREQGVLMLDRMPLYTPRPDGTISKWTPLERKALYYHGFHDTVDVDCNACAWEDAI